METVIMENLPVLIGVAVIALVSYLIYRKSQKPGKAPRVGPKGTRDDPNDR